MATLKKKNNNVSFILSVCLMLTLIVALMVPTAMAWFSDRAPAISKISINFGSVSIDVEKNESHEPAVAFTNLNSGSRSLNAILPGDSIQFEFEIYNSGTVDTYAKLNFKPKIIYGDTDITHLLYDTTTDPVNQPYCIVDNLTSIEDENFYNNGSELNQVFVLSKNETLGNGKKIKGVLQFSLTLPNSITDGINTFILNGHKENIKLVLDINMAAIQKDNNNLENAQTELNKFVESMTMHYSFVYIDDIPTLTIAGKPIKTESYYEVDSDENTKAYAFIKEVDGEKTLLAVVGEGNMEDYEYNTQPWKDVRSNVTEVSVGEGITSIGDHAFSNCTNLTTVTIPDSVTSIGNHTFHNCASLTNVVIPNSVTSIGKSVFYNCTSLTSVNIPNGITSIDFETFYNCTNLTNVSIPETVTYIGEDSFYNCTNLTNITIPDGVTYIDESAFYNCTSLTSINIPNSITHISYEAFYNCTNLNKINISNNITFIGEDAFKECISLENIIIPKSVEIMESNIFSGWTTSQTIFMEHSSSSEIADLNSSWLDGCQAKVVWFSETNQAGYWHYDTDEKTPVLW